MMIFASCGNDDSDKKENVQTDNDTVTVTDTDIPENLCGNGNVDSGEKCDGGTVDCSEIGKYRSSKTTCLADCSGWDTESCELERLDFEGPDYEGNVILVINSSVDGKQMDFSGTLKSKINVAQRRSDGDRMTGLRSIHIPLPEGIDPESRVMPRRGSEYKEGDTRVFFIEKPGEEEGSKKYMTDLLYAGEKALVWAVQGVGLTAERAKQIGEEFDKTIFPLVSENFHNPQLTEGKVNIVFNDLGPLASGFFFPGDLFEPSAENPNTNQADIVYITTRNNNHLTPGCLSTLTHEFQHMVHSKRNRIVEKDMGIDDFLYLWIDEGLAMAAQHLYGGIIEDKLSIYNYNYKGAIGRGHSLFFWDYFDNDKVFSNYALSYLFFQYLRIQADNDTTIYKEIIECEANDNSCVENVIQDRIDSEMTLSRFMINFRLALFLNDSEGPYGFGGEQGFEFDNSYFNGAGVKLRGGGSVFLPVNGTFTEPEDKDPNIRYIGIRTR